MLCPVPSRHAAHTRCFHDDGSDVCLGVSGLTGGWADAGEPWLASAGFVVTCLASDRSASPLRPSDLGQVTSHLRGSVSSSVKWRC